MGTSFQKPILFPLIPQKLSFSWRRLCGLISKSIKILIAMSIRTFLFSSDNESWSVTKTCELSKAIGKVYIGMHNRFDTFDIYDASGRGSTDPYDQIGNCSYHKSLTQWMRILRLTDRYWDQLCLPVEKPRVLFPVCIESVIEGVDTWGGCDFVK